jgi:hypothetical protein
MARRTGRVPTACNSLQDAGVPLASAHGVVVTHPFHPFSGRRAICVGERYNRAGRRLLLRFDDGAICSVPPQWTDVIAPDPEIIMGHDRALFRVTDLLELARLVARLATHRPDTM